MRINLPNQVTLSRLVLAVLFFVLLACINVPAGGPGWLINAAFVVFIISALLDVVDGYLARKYKQETGFGRVMDPFVDKMLVLGGFVFLLGENITFHGRNASGVEPWMVAVILGRELLISVLRGVSEQKGAAFGANWVGKLKTFLQNVALGGAILQLHYVGVPVEQAGWISPVAHWSLWAAVIFTAVSMVAYIWRGRQQLKMHHEEEMIKNQNAETPK